MSNTISKYFGDARYKEAKRIEDFRERERWFQPPSYMQPIKGLSVEDLIKLNGIKKKPLLSAHNLFRELNP